MRKPLFSDDNSLGSEIIKNAEMISSLTRDDIRGDTAGSSTNFDNSPRRENISRRKSLTQRLQLSSDSENPLSKVNIEDQTSNFSDYMKSESLTIRTADEVRNIIFCHFVSNASKIVMQ